MRIKLSSLFLLIILTGCATGYQSTGLTGGYSSTQLDENVFRVFFRGNGATDMERATDFTLLRSAELAIENGFKYFIIIDEHQDEKISTITTPTTVNTNSYANTTGVISSYGNRATYNGTTSGNVYTKISEGQSYTIAKPRVSNTIVCFKEKPEGKSYNA